MTFRSRFVISGFLISLSWVGPSAAGARVVGGSRIRVKVFSPFLRAQDFPRGVKMSASKTEFNFTREQREAKFSSIKLSAQLEAVRADDLERDLLFVYLRGRSVAEIEIRFGYLSRSVIEHAKREF